MNLQVLVVTINNESIETLLKKMNIKTNAIICNQCKKFAFEEKNINNNKIQIYNFNERGVGLNRNNGLMRASGDICLFADDDMTYEDDYEEKVKQAFIENPDADVIIFNLRGRKAIKKKTKVNYFNYLRYGTARIAIRLKSIKEKGIYFNQCFGGGTEHSHGEDNLFLTSCLKNRLKIYSVPVNIATLTEDRESTWRSEYNEKYLKDQGILYRTISRRMWRLLCLQDSIRRHKAYNMSWLKAYNLMTKSIGEKNGKTGI